MIADKEKIGKGNGHTRRPSQDLFAIEGDN